MAERIVGPRAIVGIRRRTVEVATASWEVQYRRYFEGLRRRVLASARPRLRGKGWPLFHVKQSDVLDDFPWGDEKERLRSLLNQQYLSMTETVWEEVVTTQVGRKLDFDLSARGVDRIIDKVGTRITQINEGSQRQIADLVQREVENGSNADRLEATLDRLLRSWGESGGRAHIIALTESGFAYNYAAMEGYRESGMVEMVQVYDGPECGWTEHDDPDLADGSVRTLEEAEDYPLSHPHCQRAFGPVVLEEERFAADEEENQVTGEEPPEPTPEEENTPLDLQTQQDYDDWQLRAFGDIVANQDITSESLSALQWYGGGGYAPINGALRGTEVLDDAVKASIRAIDDAMRPLPDTVVVRRGVYTDAFSDMFETSTYARLTIRERMDDLKSLLPGQVVEDPGYLSTSMSPSTVIADRDIALVLTVPKGKPSFPVVQVNPAFDYEKELLLARGTRYVVTDARIERNQWGVEKLIVEGTVLP